MSAQSPGTFRSRAYQIQSQGVRLTSVLPIPFVEASLVIPDFEFASLEELIMFSRRFLKVAENLESEDEYEVENGLLYYGSSEPKDIRRAAKQVGRVPVQGSGWEEIFRCAIFTEVGKHPQQYGSVSVDSLFDAEVGNYIINDDAFVRDDSGHSAAPQVSVSGMEYENDEPDEEPDESVA